MERFPQIKVTAQSSAMMQQPFSSACIQISSLAAIENDIAFLRSAVFFQSQVPVFKCRPHTPFREALIQFLRDCDAAVHAARAADTDHKLVFILADKAWGKRFDDLNQLGEEKLRLFKR